LCAARIVCNEVRIGSNTEETVDYNAELYKILVNVSQPGTEVLVEKLYGIRSI
jgi:hypothetical protein